MVYWKANVFSNIARHAFVKASSTTGHSATATGPVANAFFTSQFSAKTPSSLQYFGTQFPQSGNAQGNNAYHHVPSAHPQSALIATSANDDHDNAPAPKQHNTNTRANSLAARSVSSPSVIAFTPCHGPPATAPSGLRTYSTLETETSEGSSLTPPPPNLPPYMQEGWEEPRVRKESEQLADLEGKLEVMYRAGRYLDAISIYEHARANNTKPTRDMYNLVLRSCVKEMQSTVSVEKLVNIYFDMLSVAITPNTETYTAIIKALCAASDRAVSGIHAIQSRKRLQGQLSEADLDRLATFQKDESLEFALQVFNGSLSVRAQEYSVHFYDSLLHSLYFAGRHDDLIRIFTVMEQQGIKPSCKTYLILMYSYEQKKDLKSLLACYEQNKESKTFTRRIHEFSMYACIIRSCIRAGEDNRAERFFERILRVGGPPKGDHHVYAGMLANAFISGYAQKNDLDGALKQFWRFKNDPTHSYNVDTWECLSPILRLCIEQGNMVHLKECWKLGCELAILSGAPSRDLRLWVTRAFMSAGEVDEVVNIIRLYWKGLKSFDVDVASDLPALFLEHGQHNQLVEMFKYLCQILEFQSNAREHHYQKKQLLMSVSLAFEKSASTKWSTVEDLLSYATKDRYIRNRLVPPDNPLYRIFVQKCYFGKDVVGDVSAAVTLLFFKAGQVALAQDNQSEEVETHISMLKEMRSKFLDHFKERLRPEVQQRTSAICSEDEDDTLTTIWRTYVDASNQPVRFASHQSCALLLSLSEANI